MKRDPALITLSHDHHHALFVAQKLTRATPQTAAAALAALKEYWSDRGEPHFRSEEQVLFPAYARHADPSDPLLAKALHDHAVIRQHIQALEDTAASDRALLAELGRLIAEHVRLEERELFPHIEAALPAVELAAVAEALERATESGGSTSGSRARIQRARGMYEAFAAGDRRFVEEAFTDDFVFSSPVDVGLDRHGYFERCWPGSGHRQTFEFVRLIASGDELVVTYEMTRADGAKGRNTEVLTFRGDQICRAEVYFGWELGESRP